MVDSILREDTPKKKKFLGSGTAWRDCDYIVMIAILHFAQA